MRVPFVLFVVGGFALYGQPHSPNIQSGTATVSHAKNHCDIVASDCAIINWDSFSIAQNESTYFSLPSEKSVVLNRVTGSLRSEILGLLKSNGELVLINHNGIFIGNEGVIDTAGFIGSTLDVLNEDFLRGQELIFSGESENSILNLGTINSRHGDLVLLSRKIENKGRLAAANGGVHQGAGRRIFLAPKGDRRITIEMGEGSIVDEGSITALSAELCSKNPYERAIHVSGEIEAATSAEKNGRIYLVADEGRATLCGSLVARGGEVQILGTEVVVDEGSSIDVSHFDGGGSVLIGGDYQGQNPAVMNASFTYVGPNVSIKADAHERGNGGKVIVWADRTTDFYGVASVCGGATGGDGGLVEVSGAEGFYYKGKALRSAPFGKAGTLLLDPEADISIQTAGPTSGGAFAGGVFTPTATTSIIEIGSIGSAGTLLDELDTGDVIINTAWAGPSASPGDVTVVNSFSWGGTSNLTINCARTFTVNTSVTIASTGSGDFTVNANSGGVTTGTFNGIVVNPGASITTVEGDISLSGTSGDAGTPNYGILINGSLISTGTGAGAGNITLNGVTGAGVTDSNRALFLSGATVTTVDGEINFFGQMNCTGNANVGVLVADHSTVSSTGTTSLTSPITINGTVVGGGANNFGFNARNNGNITSVAGDIVIEGTADGTSVTNSGMVLSNGSITSTGTGADAASITLTGTGSNNGTSNSRGIVIANLFTASSVEGSIVLNGTGGTSSGSSNVGVLMTGGTLSSTGTGSNAASISITGIGGTGTTSCTGVLIGGSVTAVDGAITLDGTGGGTQNQNSGVEITGDLSSTGVGSGVGTITILGQGSTSATSLNHGLRIAGQLTTVDGNIVATCTGGGNGTANVNHGISIEGGVVISGGTTSDAGTITFNGTGGNGLGVCQGINLFSIGSVTSVAGDINWTGVGNANGASNSGISISSTVSSTGSAPNAAAITLNGTGGAGTQNNDGVDIQGLVTSLEGAINITGQGAGTMTQNTGIRVTDLGKVTSTGVGVNAAPITLTGTASPNGTTNGIGVFVNTPGAEVSSVDGTITITGTGAGSGINCHGVNVSSSGVIDSTGTGNISITGSCTTSGSASNGVTVTGSSSQISSASGGITINGQMPSAVSSNAGIAVASSGSVLSTSGTINFNGSTTGGTTDCKGVIVSGSGSLVTTSTGSIDITALGSGSGTINIGMEISNGGKVTSTGNGAGPLSIRATGSSSGTTDCHGAFVTSASAEISSVTGDVSVVGIAGGTTTDNHGVFVSTNGSINSTGAGASAATLTLNGTSNTANSSSSGISLNTSGIVTSVDGAISLTGQCGGSGTSNAGIDITDSSSLSSTGTASIELTGMGSLSGGNNCHGVNLASLSTITTLNGDVTGTATGRGNGVSSGFYLTNSSMSSTGAGSYDLIGISLATGNGSCGILLDGQAEIASSGTGALSLDGMGGASGSSSYGICLTDSFTSINSDAGTISLIGRDSGGTEQGILITNSAAVTSNVSAPIEIATFSDMDLTEGGQILGGSGLITVDIARDLNITGGSGAGLISGIILADGDLRCSTGRNLNLRGGSGASSHAQIGSRSSTSTANISFPTIGGNATINGTSLASFSLVGHGDETLIGTNYSGDIRFANVRGNISVQGANGGAGALGFGQVGHLNATGSTIAGNINMNAMGSIFVTGGTADPNARARIGHGGVAGVGTFNASEMTLIANFNFEMNSPAGGGTAEVVNLSQQPGSGNLTIVVDNEFPTSPLYGTGSFVLNSTLSATGELRIYTVQPTQNSINDLINGSSFVASPIGVDTNDQQYSIYYPGGTYIGPDFMVYYKLGMAQMMMMQMVDVIDLQIAESQLQTLLPVFLYMRLPFYPWHHPSFCMYDRCDPGFDPYGSFIFEDDVYWIGAKK